MTSCRASCEAVLRGNDRRGRGRYTIPSPKLYPHQWAWDSAFAAIGWAYLDPDRAWAELESLLDGQWDDGRVPHIIFHDLSASYFPGPDFWQTKQSSSISQPPIWASCARVLDEICPSERLKPLLAKMDASHRFFHEQRDPKGWNLVAVAHPWESGLDNCPAWDAPMSRVDVSNPPAFQRRDLEATGDASVRPSDDHYLRYACLVKAIAEDGFGPGPFAVYDPMMSAILARAERDLAALCHDHGVETEADDRAARIEAGLKDHLWDAELGRFIYYDARADERITHDLVGGYMPLWCAIDEGLAEQLVTGLRERFWTRYPVPSCAPSDPEHEPRRYWRGPTWLNVNWMLCQSLPDEMGDELAAKTVALVRDHGIREYFHPETGEGLGGEDFTWSAALAIDLIERLGVVP
jgi:hypothetical protein